MPSLLQGAGQMAIYTAAECLFDGVFGAVNRLPRSLGSVGLAPASILLLAQLGLVCSSATAQTTSLQSIPDTWTAVTISRFGWGAGRAPSINVAIAFAINNCRSRSPAASDCGAEIKTIKGGWILALRCGNYRVLTSGSSLEEAEDSAAHRILQLKYISNIALASCIRLLQIGPSDWPDVFGRSQISRVFGDK
jgi:hypothetical protein